MVWRSDTGGSWSRPVRGAVLDQAGFVNGLLVTTGNLVAFGTSTGGGAATWSSVDGSRWSLSPALGQIRALAVTRGRLVALVDAPLGPAQSGIEFTSADGGRTWVEAAQLGPVTDPGGGSAGVR